MDKTYTASLFEDEINTKWEKSGIFKAQIDRQKKPYTISMPPPNATGVLHLGHAVMLAIQDTIIRQKRMAGYATLWLPGTDHASIATENKVEELLRSQGKKKLDIGREAFLAITENFVKDSQQTIKNQIKKMGASCDWSREKYTKEESMNKAVIRQFQAMFEDGLIYRGGRMVNWDAKMQTTVADDEIEYTEEKTNFYYFQFGPIVIGTARPETKFLDNIIVVHPEDPRYKDLHNQEFEAEWIEGKIKVKIITDTCIDPALGTGAMSITPAHSLIDYEIAKQHNFETPQIIDFNGKITAQASTRFAGMEAVKARNAVVETLKAKGLLIKIDTDYIHNIAKNYRGGGVIEPQIMKQWFIDVNKKVILWKGEQASLKEVMRDVVETQMIQIIPQRFDKTYFHWIDNLKDWCISRQIWWGHRIPVWYEVEKEQYVQFQKITNASSLHLELLKVVSNPIFSIKMPVKEGYWIQDPDTLDTWFSSALWTFATLGWPEETEDLQYFHPTALLETGYDILFFWVARMILSSTYLLRRSGYDEEKSLPFKQVYLHGLIRDKNGKKMSKSAGNGIDPLEMIEKYGTDAVRLSLIIGNTPGNDIRLYEDKIAGYRNFINKIWNGARFALMNLENYDFQQKEYKTITEEEIKTNADRWILSELANLIAETSEDFEKLRISDAGNKIYDFFWSKYCDWYLELSKNEDKNPEVLYYVLKTILKLLHPFTPFVTEKIWENFQTQNLLTAESWPKIDFPHQFPKARQEQLEVQKIIMAIRSAKTELKIPHAQKINVTISGFRQTQKEINKKAIQKLARVEKLEFKNKLAKDCHQIILGKTKIGISVEKNLIDKTKEKEKILKEIEEIKQNIEYLKNKLENPSFTLKAPPLVVEKEKERYKKLCEHIKNLNNKMENS